jgi:hypothetical protein
VQHYEAIEASEGRLREQMQALQRKLVRVVTENEALRHVVDKLQCSVLSLRRQLQRAGMAPDVELDDSLLRPSPHQARAADASLRACNVDCCSCGSCLLSAVACLRFV